ncbi:uncharacterized protein LOC127873596 [Dreissena polymorpha]|uniref:uncharacterized protein LOC127873596 n=1 Tax=Dreissena polymorpha TaxID=45954 RepID=UPI0022654585|nr:uncharacterized protein LOC127873596 [Dreissena polymorpha]
MEDLQILIDAAYQELSQQCFSTAPITSELSKVTSSDLVPVSSSENDLDSALGLLARTCIQQVELLESLKSSTNVNTLSLAAYSSVSIGDTLASVLAPVADNECRPVAVKPTNTRRARSLELGEGDTGVYKRKRKEAGLSERTGRREYKRPRQAESKELQALCRLLPVKRIHDFPVSDAESPKKRRRSRSSSRCGSSDIESEKFNDSFCADKTDREIDIQYQGNPCHSSCPCRPSYKALEVLEIPRRRRKRVSVPLYNKFLQYRLLKVTDTCVSNCCQFRCFQRWIQYGTKSIRMIFRDYY